ncbi:hypothetical protein AGLY_001256 [Aphis glycines]|uniref:Uncharacterized protein n=1 Tax=Aphis glycines TaxID=307491 RepID=A0A6G0U9S9_APHGL|nr:hypothetical protein AGLY_001256 [Aphis glycines]
MIFLITTFSTFYGYCQNSNSKQLNTCQTKFYEKLNYEGYMSPPIVHIIGSTLTMALIPSGENTLSSLTPNMILEYIFLNSTHFDALYPNNHPTETTSNTVLSPDNPRQHIRRKFPYHTCCPLVGRSDIGSKIPTLKIKVVLSRSEHCCVQRLKINSNKCRTNLRLREATDNPKDYFIINN